MNFNSNSVPGRILVYSTFAVILTLGMRELAPILTSIFFSIFAALIFSPLILWLKKRDPRWAEHSSCNYFICFNCRNFQHVCCKRCNPI